MKKAPVLVQYSGRPAVKLHAADVKQDPDNEQVDKLHQKSRDIEVVTAKYLDTRRPKIARAGAGGGNKYLGT